MERSRDRLDRRRRLVGQEDDRQQPAPGVIGQLAQSALRGAPPASARQAGNEVGKEVGARRGNRQHRPDPGLSRQRQPSRNREGDKCRRDQAAAQIVEYLPAVERRKPVGTARVVAARCGSAQPGRQLPVAADPAKGATGIREIVCGEVLIEDDVAGQRGTAVKPLEQIVADDRVLRHAAMQASVERRDVEGALAGEYSFAEQVLIDVRDRTAVDIDRGIAGIEAGEQRPVAGLGQRSRPAAG